MSGLEEKLPDLFEAARTLSEPTPDDRVQIRSALAAKLGTGAALTAASAKSAASAGAASAGVLAHAPLKLLTAIAPAVLAGALLGGAVSLAVGKAADSELAPKSADRATSVSGRDVETPRAPTLARVPAAAGVPNASASGLSPNAAGLPSAVARKVVPIGALPKRAVPEVTDLQSGSGVAGFPELDAPRAVADLDAEFALVSRMHAAWSAGDSAAARSAIRAHEQRFAAGTLVQEREALKVMLACREASPARARELVTAFTNRHRGSPHAARVEAACTSPARNSDERSITESDRSGQSKDKPSLEK